MMLISTVGNRKRTGINKPNSSRTQEPTVVTRMGMVQPTERVPQSRLPTTTMGVTVSR